MKKFILIIFVQIFAATYAQAFKSDFTERAILEYNNGVFGLPEDTMHLSDLALDRSIEYWDQSRRKTRIHFHWYELDTSSDEIKHVSFYDGRGRLVVRVPLHSLEPGSFQYHLNDYSPYANECNGVRSLYLYAYDHNGSFLGEGFCIYYINRTPSNEMYLSDINGNITLVNVSNYSPQKSKAKYFPVTYVLGDYLSQICPTLVCMAQQTNITSVTQWVPYYNGSWKYYFLRIIEENQISRVNSAGKYHMNLYSNSFRWFIRNSEIRLLFGIQILDKYPNVYMQKPEDLTACYFGACLNQVHYEVGIPISEMIGIEVEDQKMREDVISYMKQIAFPLPHGSTYESFVISRY